jgi:hypothetical protein
VSELIDERLKLKKILARIDEYKLETDMDDEIHPFVFICKEEIETVLERTRKKVTQRINEIDKLVLMR